MQVVVENSKFKTDADFGQERVEHGTREKGRNLEVFDAAKLLEPRLSGAVRCGAVGGLGISIIRSFHNASFQM